MLTKPLLDVNICMDLLLKRNPYISEAAEIFQQSEHGEIEAVIAAISIDTLSYLMRFDYSVPAATKKLKEMASIITIGVVNGTVITSALDAAWNDIEDAIQYYCAKQNGCDAIITRNQKDFKQAKLPILSPQEFLAQMHSDVSE